MIIITVVSILITAPVFSKFISPTQFNRIATISLLSSSIMAIIAVDLNYNINISLYNNAFMINNTMLIIQAMLFVIAAMICNLWAPINKFAYNIVNRMNTSIATINEHTMVILFSVMGAAMLMISNNLISLFVAIELQSLSLYVIATIYRYSESSTAAGLKYLLLGGFSSAFILLGTALLYMSTGIMDYTNLTVLLNLDSYDPTNVLGITLIIIGLLFKVASAPIHNWAPDVYQGTPTIITTWLTIVPKISLFMTIYVLSNMTMGEWSPLFALAAFCSLVTGTVLGLSQFYVKRLLTYSTISHVGFILLALSVDSIDSYAAFIFYLMQYTISNLCMFSMLLAIGYIRNLFILDVCVTYDLAGLSYENRGLAIGFSLALFSIAGIPPLVGFFGKLQVLYSAMANEYYILSLVAIVCSVISAYYYLSLVRIMYFDKPKMPIYSTPNLSNIHVGIISITMMVIVGFLAYPTFILDICYLLAIYDYQI